MRRLSYRKRNLQKSAIRKKKGRTKPILKHKQITARTYQGRAEKQRAWSSAEEKRKAGKRKGVVVQENWTPTGASRRV